MLGFIGDERRIALHSVVESAARQVRGRRWRGGAAYSPCEDARSSTICGPLSGPWINRKK